MIIKFYSVYYKHDAVKNCDQTREKWQILSEVLEYFCCQMYTQVAQIVGPSLANYGNRWQMVGWHTNNEPT